MEQKTLVFCQTDVQEFHLGTESNLKVCFLHFLDIILTKIFSRRLFHAIHSHLHQRIYSPGFLELEISAGTAESGRGLGFVCIASLFNNESSVDLFLITLYLY
jgi:hypothetical protein